MTTAPIRCGRDGPPEAHTASPECHPPESSLGPLPVQRKAEEVEGRASALAPLSGRPKAEAASLLRVEGQAERFEPLLEQTPYMRRILCVVETQHEIIRISNELAAPSKTRSDFAFEPHVEDVVQVHVPQQRGQT